MIVISVVDDTSFLDGFSNTEIGESKLSTMHKLEQRTCYLEKKVEELETIVGNMEIGRPFIEEDIFDGRKQNKKSV